MTDDWGFATRQIHAGAEAEAALAERRLETVGPT